MISHRRDSYTNPLLLSKKIRKCFTPSWIYLILNLSPFDAQVYLTPASKRAGGQLLKTTSNNALLLVQFFFLIIEPGKASTGLF